MDFLLFLVLSIVVTLSNGYKVLVMGPFNGKSHFMFMSSFVKALLERGHKVTYLTSNTLIDQDLTNYTEVLIDPPFDLMGLFPEDLSDVAEYSTFAELFDDVHLFSKVINPHAFESENVQKFINSTDLHFDVIINEEFFGDSFLMFSHKFKAPIITICPFGISNDVDLQMGLITPISIAPHWMLPYTDNMTFFQRWHNAILTYYDWFLRRFYFLPAEEALTKKYFAHLAPLPSIYELINNISVIFVNNHIALSPPRPAMPGTINVGGAHIKPTKPLPDDLQTILDESKDGVIYFSLGTIVKSSSMPREKIQAFLDVFSSLKQRILWKFEDESLDEIPPNVVIRKWMPQNDILAHPNVVLFIGHGGLFGTYESLYHGVPLLLIPFFGDQNRNAHRVATAGYGKFIPYSKLSKTILAERINELLSDKTYLMRAKESGAVFRDNPNHPMDEAMFWIEHVAKFKGAKHLKSAAVKMSWFSYLSIDILIVNLLMFLTVLMTLCLLCRKAGNKLITKRNWRKKHD